MEEQTITQKRRRKRTQMGLFKEAYLPYIILTIAALLIVIFIIGALVRNAKVKPENLEKQNPSTISASATDDWL